MVGRVMIGLVWVGFSFPAIGHGQAQDPKQCFTLGRGRQLGTLSAKGILTLSDCGEPGVTMLVRLWSDDPSRGVQELEALAVASIRAKDRRLFQTTLAVLASPSHSVDTRLTALGVVTGYLRPGFAVSADAMRTLARGVSISTALHDQPTGSDNHLLVDDDRRRAFAALAALSRSGADPTVQMAARRLRELFAREYPDLTPLQPGSIVVTNPCGNRLLLRNQSDIALGVAVLVPEGGFREVYQLEPQRGSANTAVLITVPPGSGSISFGTRQFAQLTLPGGACH